MKVLILLLATVALALSREITPQEPSVFGYLTKYGIPEAERIRKIEEENANSRIIGGQPSDIEDFPYQVGLVIDMLNLSGSAVCGGSLISLNRILTAAHCWFDGENRAWRFTVVLGSRTLFTGGQRIQTTETFMHPQWQPENILNDVAVSYLPYNVQVSDTVATIALPSGNDINNDFVGYSAVASGFGLKDGENGISQNQFLSHVNLNVMTNSVCNYYFFGFVQSSNICTSGSGTVGVCSGDSGGPLVTVGSNGQPIQIGLTSFGSGISCQISFPSVYARITSFLSFINQHL